jgi:predicted DNA-binding protein (MmcQ/YjbR family)
MNAETIRSWALALPDTDEGFPFGPDTLIFKVAGKMFLALSLDDSPPRFNFKAPPEVHVELRERWPAVMPGYHMNKQHWSTVVLDGSVPPAMLQQWVEGSWASVVAGMPAAERRRLQALRG